jgi:hypothetical protein
LTGLLLVLLLVGLTLVSLLGDLCRHDLDRSRAMAEAALRRALEAQEWAHGTRRDRHGAKPALTGHKAGGRVEEAPWPPARPNH